MRVKQSWSCAAACVAALLGGTLPRRSSAAPSPWFSSASAAPEEATTGGSSDDSHHQQQLVSPLLNRELKAKVKASWPSSPHNVFCEAFAYLSSSSASASSSASKTTKSKEEEETSHVTVAFLNNLANIVIEQAEAGEGGGTPQWTYESAWHAVVQASSPFLSPTEIALLQWSVAMRASSPTCELHRTLAHAKHSRRSASEEAFVVAHPSGKLVEDVLIPDEPIFPQGVTEAANTTQPMAVLYANLGTLSFARRYRELVQEQVPFVVRHLGSESANSTEVSSSSSSSSFTVLQGYGVSLDIRNVEYKVFDDRSDASGDGDTQFVNVTDPTVRAPPEQFLAGINLTHIGVGLSETDRQILQESLWRAHDAQQLHTQIVPPVWQRRQLPLQATAVIAESKDPLVTLQEVSQNLPSVASTLVHVKVPDDLVNRTKGLQSYAGRVYVNGVAVHMGLPTFNAFEFLNLLRDEQRKVADLQRKLGPYLDVSQLTAVQHAWSRGSRFLKDAKTTTSASDASGDADENMDDEDEDGSNDQDVVYRVDVGHGWKNAVIYLNDVEKDAQYSRWPVRLDQMLMMMQFGRPPSARRNLFTFLSVIDPVEQPGEDGLNLAFQVMGAQYPARTGILIVNDADVRKCAQWVAEDPAHKVEGKACPVGPVIPTKSATMDALKSIKASAHAVHTLVAHFASTYGNKGDGAMQAYAEYLLEYIGNEKDKNDGELSMRDLVTVHGSLMKGLNILTEKEAEAEALAALLEGSDEDDDYSYGKSLRFAVDKSLMPGLCFLNGRPMPPDGAAGAEMFRSEQSLVFSMIMTGEITDRAPRSVYGKLLAGDLVFSAFHPLLREDSDVENKYVEPSHSFGVESLMIPNPPSGSEAAFVLEVVVDYSTESGVKIVESILDVMKSDVTPSSSGEPAVAYRFVPSTKEAAQSDLCPILSRASKIRPESLKKVLTAFAQDKAASPAHVLDASIQKTITEGLPVAIELCRSHDETLPSEPETYVALNGRKYKIEDGILIDRQALDILVNLELKRAKAVTSLLRKGDAVNFEGVSRTAAFLAREETLADSGYVKRRTMPVSKDSSLTGKLMLDWNHKDGRQRGEELQSNVVAIVDPVTFAAQRMSRLLRIVRDELRLPLTLYLAPAELIDGESKVPITSYYRFVASAQILDGDSSPEAHFEHLPVNHVLTLKVDVPEPWNVQQSLAVQDTDNLRCDTKSGCGDQQSDEPLYQQQHLTNVEYDLKSLLVFGRCVETSGRPPNGLQLVLYREGADAKEKTDSSSNFKEGVELGIDGSVLESRGLEQTTESRVTPHSDTLVMLNIGYWQLQAAPGIWSLQIANGTRGASIFDMVEGTYRGNALVLDADHLSSAATSKRIVLKDFVSQMEVLVVQRRPGFETASLFPEENDPSSGAVADGDDVINVFSLATGHLYERFLKIMMLSVTKRTSKKVKFWLFENYLSPSFKASARYMAQQIGSDVEFVTYKWPEWLRGQSEKQRIIWGYKILFLDVLFPLSVKKFIYVDADQVLRGDLKELWDLDLHGAPYGYTPFCTSRETTLGYQFWREGFWKQHLGDSPYHISALYVVDLERFRRQHVGDTLRSIYQQLSADPHSLANLDQDLPNYAQRQVPIHSLPQEWLWCESWCSDETKAAAKTIDLCNNPLHKEPKVSMAKRVISGPLFNESWVELDAEVERYDTAYRESLLAERP